MAVVLPHDRVTAGKVAGETVEHIQQIEEILDAWGREGWEVVALTVVARSGVGGTNYPRLILKRPLANEAS